MPLYRRLPKRGFKSLNKLNKKKFIATLNLRDIDNFLKNKKINSKEEINIKYLKDKNIIKNKFVKLKVLGLGELKEKLTIKTDLISKSAKNKIEKAGGLVNILNTTNNK